MCNEIPTKHWRCDRHEFPKWYWSCNRHTIYCWPWTRLIAHFTRIKGIHKDQYRKRNLEVTVNQELDFKWHFQSRELATQVSPVSTFLTRISLSIDGPMKCHRLLISGVISPILLYTPSSGPCHSRKRTLKTKDGVAGGVLRSRRSKVGKRGSIAL